MHEYNAVSWDLKPNHVTLEDLIKFGLGMGFLLTLAIIPLFISLTDLNECTIGRPVATYFLWFFAVFSYYPSLIFLTYIMMKIPRKNGMHTIFMPLHGVFSTLLSAYFASYLAVFIWPPLYACLQLEFDDLLRYYIMAQVGEATVFFGFFRRISARNRLLEGRGKTTAAPSIRILSKQFPISDLLLIQANEHYLTILTRNGEETHRTPMNAILPQIGKAEGIQPHRSFWISKDFIQDVKLVGTKPMIVCKNGTKVPVARGRRRDIKTWIAEHGWTKPVS